ncbi:cupin domain-containing protein [Haloarchaeobius amylolyticus]|uniref:cupin domain-containing protein n=1 Tax=Haloarchaeobius amylolyticus TaxID=1198296 RepID=UPI0022704A85|nr:cupin domain-containing protein [Haloarchaeobius amylolyticus]
MQSTRAVSVVPLDDGGDGQQTTVFETGDVALTRTRLAPGEATDWDTRGDRDAYGYVLAGQLRLVTTDGGEDAVAAAAGAFVHAPAAVGRWVENPGPDELVVLTAFVESARAQSAASPRVAGPDDLVPTAPLKNLTRLMPFPEAPVQQVRGHAEGRIESDWHHHGDNDVFGYVVAGEGYVEWGTGPDDRALARAGECFHVPAGLVHRDVNPSDDEQDYVLWLTGSDPRVVRVDGPESA